MAQGGNLRKTSITNTAGTATAPVDGTKGLAVDLTASGSIPAGTNGIGKLTANDGVDIGDVTINNASGGSAVNIQDGGNSITVDGTLSITANSAVNVAQYGGTNTTLGQKTSAASMPVVVSSDYNLPTVSAQASAATGTLTNVTDTVAASVSMYSAVTVTIKGTYGGANMIFEVSDDSGTTYYSQQATRSDSFTVSTTTGVLTNTTRMYNAIVAGVTNFRIRLTAITSGSVTVRITATADPMVFSPTIGISGSANSIDLATLNTTTLVTGGVAGTLGVGGSVATNVAIGTNPINVGAQGVSTENAAVTTGRLAQLVSDLYGKLIVSPHANRENFVKGIASATNTSDTSVVAAGSGSLKNYITTLAVANTGAATTLITIKDGSGGATLWQTIAPAGSGAVIPFEVPLVGTAATAVYFAAATASTTVYCAMAGYRGA